jgi:hypothetical protein
MATEAVEMMGGVPPVEVGKIGIVVGEDTDIGGGVSVYPSELPWDRSDLLVAVYHEGSIVCDFPINAGSSAVIDDHNDEWTLAASYNGSTLDITISNGPAMDVLDQHDQMRGAIPELTPPEEPIKPAAVGPPGYPRRLDRSLDYDDANDMVKVIKSFPHGYAITFPESEAPETYIRAVKDDTEIAEEFDVDTGYVAVRRDGHGGRFEQREYEIGDFSRRMTREPAVRLVHRENAPNELYPECYHDDNRRDDST